MVCCVLFANTVCQSPKKSLRQRRSKASTMSAPCNFCVHIVVPNCLHHLKARFAASVGGMCSCPESCLQTMYMRAVTTMTKMHSRMRIRLKTVRQMKTALTAIRFKIYTLSVVCKRSEIIVCSVQTVNWTAPHCQGFLLKERKLRASFGVQSMPAVQAVGRT